MNKKMAAALAGAATVMLAVSGCGSSTNKVGDYAKTVCDNAQPQFQKIRDANNSITAISVGNHTPDEVKSTDSAAFQQISDAKKALAEAVNSAGVPPVANGAQLQQNAVKELNDASNAYANLKKTVDALDTRDQAKFGDGLAPVAAQLSSVSKIGEDALKSLQSGDLGVAMAKQPGCQLPTQSPTSSASPTPSSGTSQGASGAQGSPKGSSAPSGKPTTARSGAPSAGSSAALSGSASVSTGSALGG